MTIERKVTGIMVPHGLGVAESGQNVRVSSMDKDEGKRKLGYIVEQELLGYANYDNILGVLRGCDENGEFEYKSQRGRVLWIDLIILEPRFANRMEELRYSSEPKINSQRSISWEDYNVLRRPESLMVEEIVRFSPNVPTSS